MSSVEIADRIVAFYRRLYGDAASEGQAFHCYFNPVFMHPVLTPNFSLGELDGAALRANAAMFLKTPRLTRHWVHAFPHQDRPELFVQAGYTKSLRCIFNVFSSPLRRKIIDACRIEFVSSIPGDFREEYEQGTARNAVNLPVATLRLIETVLTKAHGTLSYAVAFSRDERLIGAVTIVRAGRTTMFVNAWVDGDHRRQGVVSDLFTTASQREFADGQELAFYWTLNPILASYGQETMPVQIYETDLAQILV